MRVYLPLLGSEFLGGSLPSRRGFTVITPNAANSETIEALEDDIQTEVALVSLMELREHEGEPTVHLITTADVADTILGGEGEGGGVVETAEIAASWSEVVTVPADSGETAPAVLRVVEVSEQDKTSEAMATLWEHAFEWFGVSEKESLVRTLGL